MPVLLISRLHVITDDVVLARPDFLPLASEILDSLGKRVSVHVRGHATPTRQLFAAAEALTQRGSCVVNDRVDIALAVNATGVQLGDRSLPPRVVRRILPAGMLLGHSVHGPAQCEAGVDFVMAGSIYESASHPGQPAAGLGLISECASFAPVIAIGGITVERVPEVMAAGAYGVAVIRAVWEARNPVQAAAEFARILYEREHG